MKVLVIGDLHIPTRAAGIPEQFKTLLNPAKFSMILVTGNLCDKETYDYLRTLTSNILVSFGDSDEISRGYPNSEITRVGNFGIGLIHGHLVVPLGDKEVLSQIQHKLNVDILVSGATHEMTAYVHKGKLFLNPGTASGAYSDYAIFPTPTFIVLEIEGSSAEIYKYSLLDHEQGVKVDKATYLHPSTRPSLSL
eukprot:TRINITY_DN8422_c0_g1_i9.p1 TRINITY_DN8422_c0_g1~~TRINITY_DN8422_c0_g1_i9.p1  ORF type:complete len:216 (-),score=47.06 TRINITY_DN8422_c0_g1_i9:192-773(-)